MKAATTIFMAAAAGFLIGCVSLPEPLPPMAEAALRERAIEALKRAVRYEHAASIRAAAIEALQRNLAEEGRPWIRNALVDGDEGVRMSAAVALGTLRDRQAYSRLHRMADDESPQIQVAAIYALHRLGDTTFTGRLPTMLLDHPSAEVRRDTAIVLGMLGEPDAVKLLAKAMKDTDETVMQMALESMARLGSAKAVQQLTFSAHSGRGVEDVATLSALAELHDPSLESTFRYRLETGEFLEVRLAAARGLGFLKISDGLRLALDALDFNSPHRSTPNDPAGEQVVRVRQMAALTLGAIGDRRALPALSVQLDDQRDPRMQLAAADAILQILGPRPPKYAPLADNRNDHRRGVRR